MVETGFRMKFVATAAAVAAKYFISRFIDFFSDDEKIRHFGFFYSFVVNYSKTTKIASQAY